MNREEMMELILEKLRTADTPTLEELMWYLEIDCEE